MRNKSQIANPKKNGNCRNGFTLIEMVVAFSILAVLSTIGIAAFVNYSRSQAMQQATNDLRTALNTAKSLTATQTTNLTEKNGVTLVCPNDKSFQGYGININSSSNNYNFYIKCSGNEIKSTVYKKLPDKITFDSTSIDDIFFSVLTGGIVGSGDIVLNGSRLNLPLTTINIDSVGNIAVPTLTP